MTDLPPNPEDDAELPADSAANLTEQVEEDEAKDLEIGEGKDQHP